MEFDWNNQPFDLDSSLTQREIEESFEDPFAVRLHLTAPPAFLHTALTRPTGPVRIVLRTMRSNREGGV